MLYTRSTSPLHQCHIVLHELGHLAFDHQEGGLEASDLARLLAPNLDPSVVDRVFGRIAHATRAENEAETFADLVLAPRVFTSEVDALPQAPEPPGEIAAVLRNIERVWGTPGDA
ncbi:hypothetical protein [Actinoallomurus soli]|uniref:hypothetical protein n=1 Tax=Actinoallomurus soli TaxID=2952535 RepID=UPI0020936908|nr:hypothetical protein [Actinoallomurus soli]MCO5968343.1 hypothetical protein [Actinoallomurus soli]